MDEARETTLPVWRLQDINRSATGMWRSAEAVRKLLGERR
jgi:hypothetical protein